MDGTSLPPGFRFHPTDEELVGYYLRRKVDGLEIELEVIPAIDLYKFDPWELPDKSFLPKRDMEWYFFCPRDRKYLNGSRTNRATAAGYWKATGKDKKIVCNHAVTGLRKTLVFYCGRAPSGDRTDWVMHEYRLCGNSSQGSSSFVGSFSLCRIVKKSEQGLKIGESHGESKTRSIVSSMKRSLTSRIFKNKVLRASEESPPPASDLYDESNSSTPITSPKIRSTMKPELNSTESSYASIWMPHEMVSDASEVIAQAGDHASDCILPNEFQNSGTSWQPSNPIFSPFPSYFVEEFNPADDLGQIECMPCYPKSMNCSGVTSNGNTEVQGLKWAESSPGDKNPMNDGFEAWNLAISPQICRQASGDGCHGELYSLCGQKMTTC